MIRRLHKASGASTPNGTSAQNGTAQAGASNPSAAQVGGSVANTAIKEGTGLVAGILSGGASYLIEAVTGIFTGAFNMVTTMGTTRNNNAAQTAQMYWYKAGDRNDERETNNGFYIIVGLAIIAALVLFIMNNNKSK